MSKKSKKSADSKFIYSSLIALFLLTTIGSGFVYQLRLAGMGDREVLPSTSVSEGFGQSISFDGGYLKIADSSGLNYRLGYTIEARVKPTETPNGFIYTKGNDRVYNHYLGIRNYREIEGGMSKYEIYFAVANSETYCSPSVVSQEIMSAKEDLHKWHHIAGVVQSDGVLNLYVDGRVNTSKSPDILGGCFDKTSVIVGAREGNPSRLTHFKGQLDELRVSNVARYFGNFDYPSVPFATDENTLVLFHFNGNTEDSSGNGNNGELVGQYSFIH